MRTAMLQAPRRLEVIERRKPEAGPGEAVVRTAATAVCHTDLSIYTGEHPGVRYPVVMGHESTGVIDSLGEGVSGLTSGQHVLINPIIACGQCDQCARGAGNLCRNAGLFGREVEGSLSQYVKLSSRYLHALPPKLPLEAATLIETLEAVRGFSTFPLYFGEISIIGSRALTPQDMDPSIQLVASGAVDVNGFITAKYPLIDAAAAFEEYERNPSRILRIVIDSQG